MPKRDKKTYRSKEIAGWTIPLVKFHIPFGITGVKTNFEIDLNVLDTEHEANWKKTNPLRWKW